MLNRFCQEARGLNNHKIKRRGTASCCCACCTRTPALTGMMQRCGNDFDLSWNTMQRFPQKQHRKRRGAVSGRSTTFSESLSVLSPCGAGRQQLRPIRSLPVVLWRQAEACHRTVPCHNRTVCPLDCLLVTQPHVSGRAGRDRPASWFLGAVWVSSKSPVRNTTI